MANYADYYNSVPRGQYFEWTVEINENQYNRVSSPDIPSWLSWTHWVEQSSAYAPKHYYHKIYGTPPNAGTFNITFNSVNGHTTYTWVFHLTVTSVRVPVKVNGSWTNGVVFVKVNGSWVESTGVYVNVNGSWVRSRG